MTNKDITTCYVIRCITNLHAGSGDANYDIIDKSVQRDPLTGYPNIHSSSIKGALREYFEEVYGYAKDSDFIKYIFGSEKKSEENKMSPGEFRFLNASLLALPVRSNHQPYYLCISNGIIDDFSTLNKILNNTAILPNTLVRLKNGITLPVIFDDEQNVYCEDYEMNAVSNDILIQKKTDLDAIEPFLGSKIALCNDNDHMKSFTGSLPVIARNKLENGQSDNLWYEEVVPRETRFYFFLTYPDNEIGKKFFNEFDSKLNFKEAKKAVQLGANASIGYGICQFIKI